MSIPPYVSDGGGSGELGSPDDDCHGQVSKRGARFGEKVGPHALFLLRGNRHRVGTIFCNLVPHV